MCTLFFLIFFQIGLFASRQAFFIKGKVVSEDLVPIEFANVVLSDGDGKVIKGTITDSLGRFNLISDDYVETKDGILTVSYLGYENYTQSVEKENMGTIILHPDRNMLQEVVVTEKRSPFTMKRGCTHCRYTKQYPKRCRHFDGCYKTITVGKC